MTLDFTKQIEEMTNLWSEDWIASGHKVPSPYEDVANALEDFKKACIKGGCCDE